LSITNNHGDRTGDELELKQGAESPATGARSIKQAATEIGDQRCD
jgi:hypothetical protein